MADRNVQIKIKNGNNWDSIYPKTKAELVEGLEEAVSNSIPLNDTLTSTSTTQALTANQGKILKELVDKKANSTELTQLDTKVTSHLADNVRHVDYAVANGTNTYTASVAGISQLIEGMSLKVKFTNANSGASTLNINGFGAKAIKKSNGNDLSSGNIKAGQILHLVYTGSNFQLLGEGGEYGNVTPDKVLEGTTFGTENGIQTGTMSNRGAVTSSLNAGQSYTIPAGYHNGNGKVTANSLASQTQATAVSSDILSGKTAYVNGNKITGSMVNRGSLGTITPGTSNKSYSAGYYNAFTVAGDPDLIPSNILAGVNIFGIVGTAVEKRLTAGSNYQLFVKNGYFDRWAKNTSYTRLTDNITILADGAIRISFKGNFSSRTLEDWGKYGYYRVYKNGSPIGTERAVNTSNMYTLWTEDFNCKAGDVFAVYGRNEYNYESPSSATYNAHVSYLEITTNTNPSYISVSN